MILVFTLENIISLVNAMGHMANSFGTVEIDTSEPSRMECDPDKEHSSFATVRTIIQSYCDSFHVAHYSSDIRLCC